MERKTQKRLIKFLKDEGCYVIKTKPGPGTPVGCPDVFAFKEGWWGAFEVKRSRNAPFKPLQVETLEKLAAWSTVWVVFPENIDDVLAQLKKVL